MGEQLPIGACEALVIGGGIAGCGVFRDLSMRGVDTVLIERQDFGFGTTSRSTRIVHGGIRYLENYEFGLVGEGLRERTILLKIAPHLVKPLRFLIPVYRGESPGKLKVKVGMVFYDLLSRGKSLPSHRFISKEETAKLLPSVATENLLGAYVYFDGQVPLVERLCLENVLSGESRGGRAYNHTEVTGLLREDGRVQGAKIRDREGRESEVRAKVVVNCTGPWVDAFLRENFGRTRPLLRPTKGVHIFCEKISDEAVVFYSSEGRLLFAIPWQGYSLVGTTDTIYDDSPDAVHTEGPDLDYLRRAIAERFPGLRTHAFGTVAGLRPLAFGGSQHASKISRKYSLVDHESEGCEGLVSVLGVKITEYRSAAEKVGDLVSKKLGRRVRSETGSVPLTAATAEIGAAMLPSPVRDHLAALYGPRAGLAFEQALADPRMLEPLCAHNADIAAQVVVAVKFEKAQSVADFMLRRSSIGYTPCKGLDAMANVATLMEDSLGWSREKTESEKASYSELVAARDQALASLPKTR